MSRRCDLFNLKLHDVTVDELYDEINRIENDFASNPSDSCSDNDSDIDSKEELSEGENTNNILYNNGDADIILSESDKDSRGEYSIVWRDLASNVKLTEDFISDVGLPDFIQNYENKQVHMKPSIFFYR